LEALVRELVLGIGLGMEVCCQLPMF
jgi:hypothetical protein